jgi:hypothetical protein
VVSVNILTPRKDQYFPEIGRSLRTTANRRFDCSKLDGNSGATSRGLGGC